MKFSKTLKRCIAGAVVLCHVGVLSVPAMAAIEQEAFGRVKPGTEGSVRQSDLEQMQELVKKMQMRLTDLHPRGKTSASQLKKLNQQQESLRAATAKQILGLRSNIAQETAKAVADIRLEAQQFKAKKVSSTIIARQEQTAKLIEQRQTIMDGLFDQLAAAKDTNSRNAALNKISNQMAQWEPKKLQRNFKELPWGRPDSKVPAPVTAQDFKKLAPALEHYQVKNDKITINPNYKPLVDASTLNPDQLWKQATPTVFNSTSVGQWQKIAFNGMTLTDQNKWPVLASLPVATQAEDLKPNEDVQISQEIKDLAAQLNHNPAKIYKWVYDNIEFVPTYGSIQGSAYTLETKRGNATDTSSLLIALLRASGIPARYVSGTIDVPAEVAKDWVGGVNNLSAAANLIGQGGVPSIIMASGGKETHLRMEHIWVEAKLDFVPSKGAVQTSEQNNPNVEDSWVPLDASYKRYERTKGIDLAKAVPFDAEDVLNKAQQGATVDEANGSVQNLNTANIETATKAYQDKITAYLKQQHPTATVGDVLGTSRIKTYKSKMLSPVLPYEVVAVVRDYHTLPDTMRHYFHLNVYDETDPYASETGSYTVQFKIPSTQLRGKSLALSFRPTTDADAQTIANALPKPDASGNIDPSKLPKSLSSSIRMTGEITLDGQVLKTLPSYALGTEIQAQMGFISPNNNWSLPNKQFNAGGYHAIGYDMQGISKSQLARLKVKLQAAKNKIESKDEAQIKSLTGHDVTGSILQAVVQSYFSLNNAQDDVQEGQSGIIKNSFMSFGTFSTSLQGVYSWGVLRTAKFAGMVMDIDRIGSTIVDKDNKQANLLAFIQQQGPRKSLNENLVPEQFFNDPKSIQKNVDGISAVKVLKLANEQGQKIYQIDQSNVNMLLPQLNHDNQVMTDISNAVASGKIVITSQTKVNLGSWSGSGYIITDPNTGSGAYMISGGLNGGALLPLLSGAFAGIAAAAIFGMAIPIFISAGMVLALLAFFIGILILTAAILYNLSVYDDEQESCFWQSFGLAQAIAGVLLPTSDKTGGRYGIMLQRIIEGIATVIGITTSATIPNDTLPACIKKI
ncbi:transglutaminase domain-containing protein [Acinetobacter oleivorans]|uniref:transglutaminase-like domain-containing protein n=1 Tax=Acinetobacter oleivorans TaxID=1148157 RepID=UPI0018FF1F88|nr:transglutaminase-like domain-containing protein [Acinetobacter oleivorans]MBJ9738950.1 transglutaminase domain-containing protein [Acinetobacter oleivorans]MCU4408776.1 transglutaminase-like domain-containing protein [Acinetobacter oleivorans]